MERRTGLETAERILGRNFVGPDQLESVKSRLGIESPFAISDKVPEIGFDTSLLESNAKDYLLVLGVPLAADGEPLTINKMRANFGVDPAAGEPCFYNQDWYLNEYFASSVSLQFGWYFIRKNVTEDTRGRLPDDIRRSAHKGSKFPSAILSTYIFFANYLVNSGELIWKNDFIWCDDTDHNGDRIYVGRYVDPAGLNKRGFNIHRHLALRRFHASADQLLP